LIRISAELLKLESTDARAVLGSPDDLEIKVFYDVVLFAAGTDDVFDAVLRKFLAGLRMKKG